MAFVPCVYCWRDISLWQPMGRQHNPHVRGGVVSAEVSMSKRKPPFPEIVCRTCPNCNMRLLQLREPKVDKMEDGRTFTVTHRCRNCNVKVGIRKEDK